MTLLLNKNNPMPLYYQVAEIIRQRIVQNVYQIGQTIPTEILIQEEFGISRETARKAVSVLITEGLVEKIRGKGTYVTAPKIVHRIGSVYGSFEEIIAQGMIPSTKFLKIIEFPPPKSMRSEMQLNDSVEVVKVKRLRYANDNPAAILTSYLPVDLVPGLAQVNFSNESLYQTLEKNYHLTLSEADEIIEADSVDEKEARLLKIKKNSPVLVVKRITYLENMRVIEKLIAMYRSDIFKYRVKLKGRIIGQRFLKTG